MTMKPFMISIIFFIVLLSGCSPVKTTEMDNYRLTLFSEKKLSHQAGSKTILVTSTEAISTYQNKQMFYQIKPYEISSFAKNTWASPPAEMIFPLIVQSLEHSRQFQAVLSSSNDEPTDYRLDTQLLKLEQNFLSKPSVMDMRLKAVLTDVKNGQIIASRLFTQHIHCPSDSPYGGVMAANQATRQLTSDLVNFVARMT